MSTAKRDNRSEERADDILPEERAAGSDDPEAQAAAVLADSYVRASERDEEAGPLADAFEHRTSGDTVEP
jgi:hypothetical protein